MKRPDSPLWTNAAPVGPGPFSHLTIPDNLAEIAAQVAIDCADEIARRIKPYHDGAIKHRQMRRALGLFG